MIYLNISFILRLFLCYLTQLCNICSLLLLLECTIIFRFSKREDATNDLKEAVEVIILLQVCSLFLYHNYLSILLFLMFQAGDKDAVEKLSKRTVKVISSFSSL